MKIMEMREIPREAAADYTMQDAAGMNTNWMASTVSTKNGV